MATFSGGPPPGAGPPMNQTLSSLTQGGPGLKSFAESVKSSSGGPTNMRSFAEIMEQEKKNRNILEIKTIKNKSEEASPPDLKAEDIGELLFDILKVNPTDCI